MSLPEPLPMEPVRAGLYTYYEGSYVPVNGSLLGASKAWYLDQQVQHVYNQAVALYTTPSRTGLRVNFTTLFVAYTDSATGKEEFVNMQGDMLSQSQETQDLQREMVEVSRSLRGIWNNIKRAKKENVSRDKYESAQFRDEKYKIPFVTIENSLGLRMQSQEIWHLSKNPHLSDQQRKYYQSVQKVLRLIAGNWGLDPRARQAKLIENLRSAIHSACYQSDTTIAKELLQDICRAKFTQNYMLDYHKDFVAAATDTPSPVIQDLKGFANALEDTNRKLANSSFRKGRVALTKQKLEGIEFLRADNVGKSNIPEVRSRHWYQGKTITSVRHGTVVISPKGDRILAPEYLCFLDGEKKKGQKVLYINHQRSDLSQEPPLGDGSEIARSDMLHALETDYLGTLYCCSLPMDGPMFDEDLGKIGLGECREALGKAMLQQIAGVKLSPQIRISEKCIKHILLFVANNYSFPASLNREERQEFAMISYFYIKERLKRELGIDTVVTACKDNKDRGNASATIDELLLAAHTTANISSEFLSDLHTRFFGAFMIKYEKIIDTRMALVVRVAQRLHAMTPGQREVLVKRGQQMGLNNVQIF